MTTTHDRRVLIRPRFAKISIVVFVVLLPILSFSVWDYVEARRFREAVDALVRQGEPVTIFLSAKLSPEEAESARLYLAAAALAGGIYGEDSPKGTFTHDLAQAEESNEWPSELQTQLRTLAAGYKDPIGLAQRAAGVPFKAFLPGTENAFFNAGMVGLVRLASFNALLAGLERNGTEASAALTLEARVAAVVRPSFLLLIRSIGQ
jgi:hypothetical protein